MLITGSSGGIGFAIARSFAKASAAKVIITARRQGPLDEAVATLSTQFPEKFFVAQRINIAEAAEVEDMCDQFRVKGLVVDVLVLSAARIQPVGSTSSEGTSKIS